MHDATKVQMGATQSSFKVIDNKAGTVVAGKVVVLGSGGAIGSVLSAGAIIGISCGKDLSNAGTTSIVREGTKVPILIDAFTPVIGAQVQVHSTSGIAVASGTAVNAFYESADLDGVQEDGTEASCALISFVGGL